MLKIKFVIDTSNTSEAKNEVCRFLRAPGVEVISVSEPVITDSGTEISIEYNYTPVYDEEEL